MNKDVKSIIEEKKLEFYKIYNYDSCSDDKTSYFKDEAGKYIKGIEVAYETIEDNSNIYGGNIKEIQLFLMEGSDNYIVFIEKIVWSNIQIDKNYSIREIYHNQAINQFDIEEIRMNISDELKKRLKQ